MISKGEKTNIIFIIILGLFLLVDLFLLQKFFPSSYGNSPQPDIIVDMWFLSPVISIASIIRGIFVIKDKNIQNSSINQALAFPLIIMGIILLILFICEFNIGISRIIENPLSML